jgi:NAD(P)H-quinone oxidoreductase subunit 5
MNNYFIDLTYKLDELAIIMVVLISYIGICVIGFASRYMKGDIKYQSFFIRLILLICSVAIMVSSDNLWLLLMSSCFSNLILVSLMIHKSKWKAAKAAGMIAVKNYLLSAICMASAFALFYYSTGETSVSSIVNQNNQSIIIQIALLLLVVAAMAQSALWPFHRWLISSLNSPTPVSAIMHAGLINGGGFILVRFSPLYLQHHNMMIAIFIIGMISALIGTLWKLMQSDVKRMLACSTMGQMGFTFVQCGLGLFPLAIAHLFWHGMFKAYLFLASGSAAQEKRLDLSYPPKPLALLCALLCGALGSFVFAYASNKSWFTGDSTLVLMVIVFIAGSQLALSMLHIANLRSFLLACIITFTASLVYGGSTQFIAWILAPMELMQSQPLNIFHLSGILILTLAWLSILFIRSPSKPTSKFSSWMLKAYVKALNSSQSHPDTITSHRNHYQY